MCTVINEQEVRRKYRLLTLKLIDNNITITTMESCTSGLLASLISDTEGASAVMKGTFVTYSNEAKIMQGVPEKIIDEYSVYSAQTAQAMAKACSKAYNANIGIGVTGTMGNADPANPSFSIPGQVWFALSVNEKIFEYFLELEPLPERYMYKLTVADKIVDRLLEII